MSAFTGFPDETLHLINKKKFSNSFVDVYTCTYDMKTWPAHTKWQSQINQGSNLLPFRLSGKGKNCGGKAKVGGRFSGGKVPVLTSIIAKSWGVPVGKVEIGVER